ncbi:unnamed protein product [Caenorhabditis angaria]|uniref:DUF281 domain-containing protein n=1 Tax=Caenorhabditis angaria TaxID=860376 RepID=A0A9P1IBI3_9PELO|nr:unnamed protein product [Caenorhabditis angaria]
MQTFLIITVIFIPFIFADIKCHQCGGAETIPKFAKNALASINITTDPYFGDCSSTSSGNICQNGTFCIKRSRVYDISYSGVSFKWTTYTKGCAITREDDTTKTPENACYELGSSSNGTGYTSRRLDCYCTKDYCNSAQQIIQFFTVFSIILTNLL